MPLLLMIRGRALHTSTLSAIDNEYAMLRVYERARGGDVDVMARYWRAAALCC